MGLLEEAAKEIKTVGTEVFFAPCDIREYDIVKKVVKEASEKLGPITILINCAGGWVARWILFDSYCSVDHIRQFPLVAEAMTANGYPPPSSNAINDLITVNFKIRGSHPQQSNRHLVRLEKQDLKSNLTFEGMWLMRSQRHAWSLIGGVPSLISPRL